VGESGEMTDMIFKKCSGCSKHWANRDEFLSDPNVQLIGYQVNFDALDTGFFMFNHVHGKCMTTMAMHTGLFRDLYKGEVYRVRETGSVKCPGYCLHIDNLEVCPAKCECNFVREVMQVILRWPKGEAA
jgi:hypothetical protein